MWYLLLKVFSTESLFTETPVLLMFAVVVLASEELPLLLVFELFLVMLTFTPFTFTRPLQVKTNLLPGDKTSTPGGGSAEKNKNHIIYIHNMNHVYCVCEFRNYLLYIHTVF